MNIDNTLDIMNELVEGTEFTVLSEDKVLNMREKVPTPLLALNCMLGGGVPFGTVINSYGLPKTGKSTILYQMLGNFLQKYPEGIGMIIDTEASADSSRVKAMGVDTSRVLRINPTSIEDGFISISKVLDKLGGNKDLSNTKVFILWDTLTKGMAQDDAKNTRMNAQDRARIIKNYMSPLMVQIEKFDCILGLINQAVYETDRYGNRKIKSGGGVALVHDTHLEFRFEYLKGDDWESNFMTGKWSKTSISKSKISPEMYNMPMYIDVTRGGKIDEVTSFLEYVIDCGFIVNKSGWYRFNTILGNEDLLDKEIEILRDYDKSYRYAELLELVKTEDIILDILEYYLCKYLSNIYKLQSEIIEDFLSEKSSIIRSKCPEKFIEEEEEENKVEDKEQPSKDDSEDSSDD